MASLTDLLNSASKSLKSALSSLCLQDSYKSPKAYFDEGGSTLRLNTEVSEQLYFSIDQPFSSDFKPKFCVRETSEAAAGALKCMEKSQLKGMKIEKEETVKKASTRANKRAKKKKNQGLAGKGWYDLGTKKIDEDTQRDLQFLQLRSYVDPKKFMKRQDALSKYIEVGTVVPQAVDYYTDNRNKRKMSSNHFVDLLLKDSEHKKYAKRKFREDKQARGGRGNKRRKTQG